MDKIYGNKGKNHESYSPQETGEYAAKALAFGAVLSLVFDDKKRFNVRSELEGILRKIEQLPANVINDNRELRDGIKRAKQYLRKLKG
tara:strand:- start:167 stop:430 length:264 start_codon:yes stop_codon:yes gene_type:complete